MTAGPTYAFTFALLNVTDPNAGIQVWQSGALTLDVADPARVVGSLTLPGYYKTEIAIGGTAGQSPGGGTLVTTTGNSSEVQMSLVFTFNEDGFLYQGSLLGGMASILDYAAQETYLYIAQGFAPTGAW